MSPTRSVRDRSPPLDDEVDQVDETRPLLESSKPKVTPLPKTQLALLFFIRATDPICYNVIFPFINQMLLDVGGVDDPTVVGYRAGLVSPSPSPSLSRVQLQVLQVLQSVGLVGAHSRDWADPQTRCRSNRCSPLLSC
jgi:hypothetical protein